MEPNKLMHCSMWQTKVVGMQLHIAQGLQAVTPKKSAAITKFIFRQSMQAIQECPKNIHKIMSDYGNLLAKKPSTKS